MKKIIAFLSVLVMTIAMSAMVSFAADNEVVFDTKVDGSTVTIDLSVNTTYTDLKTIGMFLDMNDVLAKGGTVTTSNGDATVKYVSNQKMVSVAFAPTDAHKYVSGTVLGTITITGVTDNFTIVMAPITNRTTTKFSSVASGDVTNVFKDSIATTVVVKEEAKTKTVAFTADLAAVGKGYMFEVTDTTANLTANTDAFDFVTDIAAAESVTVGLIIENVPFDNVLTAVAKLVF